MSDKAVITCALNGVLTDPKQHHVPVTPEEMAREARAAFNAGASVMHIHLRQQAPNKGHLPSWEVSVSREIQQAIREACPGVIINHTTGTSGPNYSGALDCVRETRPEMAACNAGSLNYLKVKSDNTWAWPPMMFDNAVEKIADYLEVMKGSETIPEFECFDVGIVRCVGMYRQTGMYSGPLEYNFVMGVASGMPADPELLPILLKLKLPEAHWQVTAIGRAEIWPLHQRCADLGGHLRTGLEDTFYQPDGAKVTSNGQLIETHRSLRAPRRPRDRQSRRSTADFRHQALNVNVRRHCERSEAIHVRSQDGMDCFVASLLAMTVERRTMHERSDCNRRRAGSGPHRPGGDRRSVETRGAALSRSSSGDRRRAARDLHRDRARRQSLRQLSGRARIEAGREDFDHLQQFG